MPRRKKDFLKKSLAILGCAALISLSFPGVNQAASKPSSFDSLNPERLFSLISPLLSLVGHDFSSGVYDSAAMYCLSSNDKDPKTTEETGKQKQKGKGAYDDSGNLTSRKKANGRD
ncbi:MAG: hypothetical protein JSV96_09530 [Candidatus Aminicenantes bacterium]|nr:MAG: hypothetical protein JSV96_09530 [Candidatus Aminicenantes bacterium]